MLIKNPMMMIMGENPSTGSKCFLFSRENLSQVVSVRNCSIFQDEQVYIQGKQLQCFFFFYFFFFHLRLPSL